MKVLLIIHTMGHGGAENIFRWLAWGLKRRGVEVIAAVPVFDEKLDNEDWITPALEDLGIPYETYDKSGSPLQMILRLRRLIKKTKPDLVHSHLMDSNFYSSLAARLASVPHVCTEHGDISLKDSRSERFKFLCLSTISNSVICVSEAVRSKAADKMFLGKKPGLVYNGITMPEADGTGFREEFSIPVGSTLVGNVANLYPVKGQKFLVSAFSGFLESFPDSYLVFVGRGSERQPLEELARAEGIPGDRIIFTGFRDDVSDILSSLDIYVQPSLSEGLPVSVLEAMIMGVPVVATRVGGLEEIIKNDTLGTLVEPGSSKAILDALLRVAGGINKYKDNAATARAAVIERFSLDRMTEDYLQIYESIVGPAQC